MTPDEKAELRKTWLAAIPGTPTDTLLAWWQTKGAFGLEPQWQLDAVAEELVKRLLAENARLAKEVSQLKAGLSAVLAACEGDFEPGIYEHYKGGIYAALFLAKHHETKVPFVVYAGAEGPGEGPSELWIREFNTPGASSWSDQVTITELNIPVPRFRLLKQKVSP